ncbi:MAG TPA: chloride channel protein, partial [Sphingomonas sp.]|nr:chloride channel protein [Sphingomonas sp.]
RFGRAAVGSGIPQVIAAAQAPETSRALVSIPIALWKFGLTILVLLGGASVGREGPTVQISAALMVAWHRALRVPISPGVLIAGGAAGVAAAFNTPLAGIAFAIEELASAYEQRVAVLVMGTVMIAGLTSLGIAGDYVYFGAMGRTLPLASTLIFAPVVGLLGGLAGGAFTRAVLWFGRSPSPFVKRIRESPVLFAAGMGIVVAAIGLLSGGLTWGTGYAPTRTLLAGDAVAPGFGPLKFIASLATTLSGVPGGVFAPSLAVGAGLGNIAALVASPQAQGPIVLLGMTAYFTGVVRAPLTAVIIMIETTASRGMILPLFAVALIADATSALISPQRLYHGLSMRFRPAE